MLKNCHFLAISAIVALISTSAFSQNAAIVNGKAIPKAQLDKLVQKSVINDNYALKSHDELRNNIFIPCNFIDIFYNDSLFYLHFHSALYIELLKYNIDNRFDITKFQTLINNLIRPSTSIISSPIEEIIAIRSFNESSSLLLTIGKISGSQ